MASNQAVFYRKTLALGHSLRFYVAKESFMKNRLDEIIAHKRTEIEKLLPLTEKLRFAAAERNDFRSFANALKDPLVEEDPRMSVIAEVKKASPSAGVISNDFDPIAIAMDYEVLVTDPREQFLRQWEGPAVRLLQGMPDDVIRENADHPLDIVITLTHDPRIDDMALMEALLTDAWYVGALGSARTTQKRLQRLAQLDIPAQNIARLHAPVGLDIGSKTPIEIAVAIMAQITQLRRREGAPLVELPG
jgi:xanthine/CO dehydrogenase XdhC/CoxF family maturation factor